MLVRLNGKMDKLTGAVMGLTTTMERYIVHAETQIASGTVRDDQRTNSAMQRILDALDRR